MSPSVISSSYLNRCAFHHGRWTHLTTKDAKTKYFTVSKTIPSYVFITHTCPECSMYKTDNPKKTVQSFRLCRIRRLHLCRRIRPLKWTSCNDTKPLNGKAPVLNLWEIWSTLSLPLFPDPFKPGAVELVRVLFMGQIQLFNHLTVGK